MAKSKNVRTYVSDRLEQWFTQLVYWQGLSLLLNAGTRVLLERSRHAECRYLLVVLWL